MRILKALIVKEFYQIIRDPSSILIAFILPAILLPIYMYGINLDTTRLTVGIKNEDMSVESQSLADSVGNNRFINAVAYDSRRQMYKDINRSKLRGLMIIPENFSQNLSKSTSAPLQIITDGSETNTANYVENYITAIAAHWLTGLSKYRFSNPEPLVVPQNRVWYNQELNSHYFILPGTLSITLTLIGMLLTALVVSREWERGTMETLITTRARKIDIVLSKYIAYFILGFASVIFNVMVCVHIFDIPFRGSYAVLWLTSSLFLFAALGQGLFISSTLKNQFTASQAALVGGFMPSLILSGLVFPIQSMPKLVQYVTWLIPARYYLPCAQSEFLAGTIWNVILPNSIAMLCFSIVLMIAVYRKTDMRLEKC